MTSDARHLASHLDRARLVNRLIQLVQTRSENPPGAEAAAAGLAAGFCEELGLEVELHEAEAGRPSVVATWAGATGPSLTYCSHLDVVPAGDASLWHVDPFAAQISDGVMQARGAADAKGPVAAALEAVALLKASGFEPAGTLQLALVADEETMGAKGAGYLVDQGVCAPELAIVGEPTSLRLVRAQRGANWFRVTTHGLAGHGSAPERGRNAIKHAAEIVLALEEAMPDIAHEVLGGPSLNVGLITGGAKVNIIPASCVIEIDRRTVPGETTESVTESIQAAVSAAKQRFPELEATIELMFSADPFEVDPEGIVVTAVSEAIEEATGAAAELVGFRGASDARYFAAAGAETVVCGPGDIAVAHTAREVLELDELERCALVYALSFARLLS